MMEVKRMPMSTAAEAAAVVFTATHTTTVVSIAATKTAEV